MADESWRTLPPEPTVLPEWTLIWMWMRAHGDFRSLPQQQRPSDSLDPDDPRPEVSDLNMAEYGGVRERWVKAGSPKASFRQVIELIGG